MGSPASIRFWVDNEDEHPLGLYLRRGDGAFAQDLADALVRTKYRWDDPDYATRMVIQNILTVRHIGPNDPGAGLYVGTADHGENHPVLNVNWGSKTVWTDDWRVSFESYIISDALWEKVQS